MKTEHPQPMNAQADRQPLETPTQRKMHGGKRPAASPGEHFYGEWPLDIDEQPGDIEEETLDRDAPYNKSYGLQ